MGPTGQSARETLRVSRETMERLDAFAGLLTQWNKTINLVGKLTIDDLWQRHILDSAQVYAALPKPRERIVDFGSGGGFPGLVLAILDLEAENPAEFVLIESDKRKAVFLRTAARELGLNVTVQAVRIEMATPAQADIAVARALAPLSTLLSFADRHLTGGGSACFLKGKTYATEIAEARQNWHFTCSEIPSKTNPDSVLLKIGNIERA